MYRRGLITTLRANPEDTDAVRISIPLPRVDHFSIDRYSDVLHLINLSVSGVGIWSSEPHDGVDSPSPFTHQSCDYLDSQLVQFGITTGEETWISVGEMIEKSKTQTPTEDANVIGGKVVVDCGSLGLNAPPESKISFHPHPTPHRQGSEIVDQIKGETVCRNIGIPYGPEVWLSQARLHSKDISSGYFVVSPQFIGFWSKSLTLSDDQYRVRTNAIISVTPTTPKLATRRYGLKLTITGHPDLRFLFGSEEVRDEAMKQVQEVLSPNPQHSTPSNPSSPTPPPMVRAKSSSSTSILSPISRSIDHPTRKKMVFTPGEILQLPKAINLPAECLMQLKPTHFVCLTIGSRGDVQPYIAWGWV